MNSFNTVDPDNDLQAFQGLADKFNESLEDMYYIFKLIYDNDVSPIESAPKLCSIEADKPYKGRMYFVASNGWPLTPAYESIERLCGHIKDNFDNYKKIRLNDPYDEEDIGDDEYLSVLKIIFEPISQTEKEKDHNLITEPDKCYWYGT